MAETNGYTRFFPYEEPYANQREAMDRIYNSLSRGQDVLFEGACGTGKTLSSLVPALEYAREEDKTVVITTNVHQQMRQFVAEARAITQEEPIRAVVFRGKGSMCHIDVGFEECQVLRDNTYEVVDAERDLEDLESREEELLEEAQEGDDRAIEARSAVMDELEQVQERVEGLEEQNTCEYYYNNLVVVEPRVEVVVVADEVVVVVFADGPVAQFLQFLLQRLQFLDDGAPGLGGLVVAALHPVEQCLLLALQSRDVLLLLDDRPGGVPEGLTLLVADVDVTHGGLPPEDHRTDRLRPGDGAGVLDELAHLLVDVGRNDDGLARFAGVFQRGHERGQRFPRPAGPLVQHVVALPKGLVDGGHRLPLVVVGLLEGEKAQIAVVGRHCGEVGRSRAKGFGHSSRWCLARRFRPSTARKPRLASVGGLAALLGLRPAVLTSPAFPKPAGAFWLLTV